MTPSTYKPFGSMTVSSAGTVDFSVDSGFKYKPQEEEGIKDILNSAVGDFTERPLQIMIREIAKNFLIFTPIGWIILLYIVGRKYKGKLGDLYANLKVALQDVIVSLGLQKD